MANETPNNKNSQFRRGSRSHTRRIARRGADASARRGADAFAPWEEREDAEAGTPVGGRDPAARSRHSEGEGNRRAPRTRARSRSRGRAVAVASRDEASGERTRTRARTRGTSAGKPAKTRRPNPITRLVNRWFDRVMGAVKDGGISSLAENDEEYASHRTTRDFIWNTVGIVCWGLVFPIITMVASQLVGTEQAGMVSMAFTVGLLLMYVGNFGVRTYQVSDIDEKHNFKDYQISRWLTSALMIVVGFLYCALHGYGSEMFNISMGVFLFKMIDGLADVYEGRLQQMDKLYLAGISQMLRSVLALVVFSVALLITRNAVVACYAMAIAAAATFVVVTYPLALLETPASPSATRASILELMRNSLPLFLGIFFLNLIDSMPKFVMEEILPYDNQLFYNALYFPAQAIMMASQLVYKPLLVRMAGVWQNTSKRRRFDVILLGIVAGIAVITVVAVLLMQWIGIPILNFLYGVDFEELRGLSSVMLVAGGVMAAVEFLYQMITIMRRQRDVITLYCVTFGFSLLVPILLIWYTGLPGSILSYLIVAAILFVLLVWEYFRIRGGQIAEERSSSEGDAEDGEKALRPSEKRAERLRREEVLNRRLGNRR